MQNNKYYTPTLNDFYIGYKYEMCYHTRSWDKLIKPPVDFDYGEEWVEKEFNSKISIADLVKQTKLGAIRVKSLDRGDIESLGWEYFESKYPNPRNIKFFMKDNYMLAFHEDGRVGILLKDITTDAIASDYYCTSQLYLGSCPSINELRTIEKLLGI